MFYPRKLTPLEQAAVAGVAVLSVAYYVVNSVDRVIRTAIEEAWRR